MPGSTDSHSDYESSVRVVITPSQSSFFAGEHFSVTITFTNTRTPEARPSKYLEPTLPQTRTHKRGAHSISSAPLARPPTSPGTPRTLLSSSPRKLTGFGDDALPRRKGLVGTMKKGYQDGQLPQLIEQRRKKMLAKSLSVSISSQELEEQLGEGIIAATPASAPFNKRMFVDDRQLPTSPHVPSPLSRTDTLPLSSNHPHARKQSVLDGQFSLDVLSPTTSIPPEPYTPTTSLSLSTISEPSFLVRSSTSSLASPTTPRVSSPLSPSYSQPAFQPNSSNSNTVQAQTQVSPRNAFSATFPQSTSELILYSYTQLVGTVHITPETTGTPTPTQDQAYRINKIRRALVRKRVAVGGGSMDISQSIQYGSSASRKLGHGRSASFSASLISLLSPASGGNSSVMLEEIDPELPLPTFEAQPSMLAVDLSLAPGESRSYTYTIKLPDVLPPTYKGRALRFSYELVVGTCRAGSSSSNKQSYGNAGVNSISRVMKVPIRIYNHVTVDRPPRPYDILWPVSRNRLSGLGKGKEKELPETQGKVIEETGTIVKKTTHLISPKSSAQGSLEDLRQYTRRLVSSLPPLTNGNKDDGRGSEASSSTSLPSIADVSSKDSDMKMSMDDVKEQEEEEDRAIVGCREAVEILTRLPKKASYDVNKDGVKVAVLTFTKSAYRLGETVMGVVELNERVGRARVLQLCAVLEAHETLPNSVAPPQNAKNLRCAYAEHHASFTLNTLRTTFALDIPSDASPAFQVNMSDSELTNTNTFSPLLPSHTPPTSSPQAHTLGGLEWKVRLCLLVAISSSTSDPGTEGVYFKSLERDGPRGEWGSSWRAPKNLAPMEKPRANHQGALKSGERENVKTKSWTQFFVDSVWNVVAGPDYGVPAEESGNKYGFEGGDGYSTENEAEGDDERSYDGIKPDLAGGVGRGADFGGGEGWKEVKLETVECEVPIKVWPGNTAFRAVDVVFDV
ncbi:Protein sat1 [Leucoagaricus sp. SymC.cos]|nr:Protein sat1 [Leucoagaricus sp. SymC.cos]